MKTKKNLLDERQREYRNRVGHQCFMLMLYGILADAALYGAGVKWLPYPANMMALLTVCASIYQMRIIAGNASLPPGETYVSRRKKTIIIATFSIAVAAIAAVVLIRAGEVAHSPAASAGDNSATVLFIISTVSLIVLLAGEGIKRLQDREKEE